MDHNKLIELSLDTLKTMYANAASNLKDALLNGAEWNALQEYRRDVTQLEIALFKKLRSGEGQNPAENQNRSSTEMELN